MAKKNLCVAWIGTESTQMLNSSIRLCEEAAYAYGYEIVSFYENRDNQSLSCMLDEIQSKEIKTIITPSIVSVCKDLNHTFDVARLIFLNGITIIDLSLTYEMNNMDNFIKGIYYGLIQKEDDYNTLNVWGLPDFENNFDNDIEYGQLWSMDESVN